MSAQQATELTGYAAIAEVYHRTRPSYPDALLETLLRHTGLGAGDQVAEIGAGSGHFTRVLAAHGFAVTALEPVAEMRAQAPSLPGVTWTDGTFECTGLPDQSQRWVIAAQSFQHAQAKRALPEIRRILQPGGWFTAIWKAQQITRQPVMVRTYAIVRRHVPTYRPPHRTTLRRRWSSKLVGALPEGLQLQLGKLAASFESSDRLGRGLQLLSTGDFEGLVYHESEHHVQVSRDLYMDLWRSGERFRRTANPQAIAAAASEVMQYLQRERIDALTLPYLCSAWSAQSRTTTSREHHECVSR